MCVFVCACVCVFACVRLCVFLCVSKFLCACVRLRVLYAVLLTADLSRVCGYKSGFITLYIRVREWEHGNALDARSLDEKMNVQHAYACTPKC